MATYNSDYYKENAQKYHEAKAKYRESRIKQVNIEVQLDWYDLVKYYCEQRNIKVTTFVKKAVEEHLKTLNFPDLANWSDAFERKKKGEEIDLEAASPLLPEIHKQQEAQRQAKIRSKTVGKSEPTLDILKMAQKEK